MPVKRKILVPGGIFFITFTCHKWISLIEFTNGYDLVFKWFDYLCKCGHFINGYAIMPNHLHALIAFRNTGKSINSIIGNGKRFMAYEMVNRLKESGQIMLLNDLVEGVNISDCQRFKKHEVWEDSFDWKECRSLKFILQKLDYIHKNPCKGRWMLAPTPADYVYSSAGFYLRGEQGIYPVTHYQDILGINLLERFNG